MGARGGLTTTIFMGGVGRAKGRVGKKGRGG